MHRLLAKVSTCTTLERIIRSVLYVLRAAGLSLEEKRDVLLGMEKEHAYFSVAYYQ